LSIFLSVALRRSRLESYRAAAANECDEPDNQEDEKKNLRDAYGGSSDAAEPEDRRNNSYHQKDQ
jgi:hypothetical protein